MGLIGDDEADGEIVTLLEQALASSGAGTPLTGSANRARQLPVQARSPWRRWPRDAPSARFWNGGTGRYSATGALVPSSAAPTRSRGRPDLDGPGRTRTRPWNGASWPCFKPETVTDPGSPHSTACCCSCWSCCCTYHVLLYPGTYRVRTECLLEDVGSLLMSAIYSIMAAQHSYCLLCSLLTAHCTHSTFCLLLFDTLSFHNQP